MNNITNFGCFVDIGIKESGFVHISQLKAGFVVDVNEVVHMLRKNQMIRKGISMFKSFCKLAG